MKPRIALPALPVLLAYACAAPVWAVEPTPTAAQAQADLRAGCAQNYASYLAYYPLGTKKSYQFAGDRIPGDTRHYADAPSCNEEQYARYLDKADPSLVMAAYPSAAGRPRAKSASAATGVPATAPTSSPKPRP